jgi:hypothetical protein
MLFKILKKGTDNPKFSLFLLEKKQAADSLALDFLFQNQ